MKRLMMAIAFGGVFCASAATWYVAPAPDGDDGNDGSLGSPFATIQKGIDSAAKNDTVEIADGTYYITSPLTLDGKDIELKSASLDPSAVIVDAQRQCTCVSNGLTSTQIILNSITFQNGFSSGSDKVAGGIYTIGRSMITNCVVRDCYHEANDRDLMAGGIYFFNYSTSGNAGIPSDTAVNWPTGRRFRATIIDTLVTNCAVYCGDTASTSRSAHGGGAYVRGITANRVTMRGCSVTNTAPNTSTSAAYGGGLSAYGNTIITNCVFDGCAAVNLCGKNGYLGAGGGVRVHGSGVTARCVLLNSLIINNSTPGCGGGVFANANSTVSGCTITNNVLDYTLPTGLYQPGGGGIYATGSNVIIEDCLIAYNNTEANESSGDFKGGGICLNGCVNSVLSGCVIRDNTAGTGGGINLPNPDGVVVTNCVVAFNTSTNECSAIKVARNNDEEKAPLEIVDCIVVSNRNLRTQLLYNGSGTLQYSASASSKEYTPDSRRFSRFTMRNCLFAGNTDNIGRGWGMRFTVWEGTPNYAGEGRAIVIDHCTFVSNMNYGVNDTSYARFACVQNASLSSNILIKGCVFYGNRYKGGTTLAYIKAENAADAMAISNTFCEVTNTTFIVTPENGNLSTGDLKFRNETGWDFRPDVGSCLIDHGGAFEDWMGDGRKRSSSRDLGDGRYTVEQVGKYGVRVVRSNTNPRRHGAASDMGCFEFWVPAGLNLILR